MDDFEDSFEEGAGAYHLEDYEEAIELFRKAAEQGHAEAQYNLGFMFHYGQGVEPDYEEAFEWYKQAAEQ
jgi:TPR repeat protein